MTSPRPMPCVKLPYLLFGEIGWNVHGLGRIVPVRRGIAILTLGDADELRLSVAGQIGKGRRLVVRLIEDLVPHPVPVLALRVLEPRRLLPGEADDQDVVPAVLVEVEGPGEKVVGVLVLLAERALEARHVDLRHRPELQLERRRRRIVFVTRLEVGSLPPPRAGDDVVHAVVVQVAEAGALAPELVAQLDAFKGVELLGQGQGGYRQRGQDDRDCREGFRHNAVLAVRLFFSSA